MADARDFEAARNKYNPDHIELLFIAEAPPANDSRRFFYFVQVDIGDTLFLEMMTNRRSPPTTSETPSSPS